MSDTADHIVVVPKAFNIIRYVQIFLSVIVLGLAAYGVSTTFGFGGQGFGIFVVIWTWITCAYYLVSLQFAPQFYNCWAVLALECWAVIWWLSAWAWFASWAAVYSIPGWLTKRSARGGSKYSTNFGDFSDYYDAGDYNAYDGWTLDDANKLKNTTAAAAGIGAIIWILFITTLVLFGKALHAHRRSGAPYRAGAQWRNNGAAPAQSADPSVPKPEASPYQTA